MDDIFTILRIGIIIAALSFIAGHYTTTSQIIKQCNQRGQFITSDTVYRCEAQPPLNKTDGISK